MFWKKVQEWLGTCTIIFQPDLQKVLLGELNTEERTGITPIILYLTKIFIFKQTSVANLRIERFKNYVKFYSKIECTMEYKTRDYTKR